MQLANQNVLQHVDHKIANVLLKKGTLGAYKTLNYQDRAWVDMCLARVPRRGRIWRPQ